jgi:hypothetical protein
MEGFAQRNLAFLFKYEVGIFRFVASESQENPPNFFTLKNEFRMCLYIAAASNGPIAHPLDHR